MFVLIVMVLSTVVVSLSSEELLNIRGTNFDLERSNYELNSSLFELNENFNNEKRYFHYNYISSDG